MTFGCFAAQFSKMSKTVKLFRSAFDSLKSYIKKSFIISSRKILKFLRLLLYLKIAVLYNFANIFLLIPYCISQASCLTIFENQPVIFFCLLTIFILFENYVIDVVEAAVWVNRFYLKINKSVPKVKMQNFKFFENSIS